MDLNNQNRNAYARDYYHQNLAAPKQYKVCLECGNHFNGISTRVYCSPECADKVDNRMTRLKQKMKRKGIVMIEIVDPNLVFKNANYHCQRCGVHTPLSLRGQSFPNSPEMDHIIPLSSGGPHTYSNVQLLCKKCNNIKGGVPRISPDLC